MLTSRGGRMCKSIPKAPSTWLNTKASPSTLVKGLLEIKRVMSTEKHLEMVKRALKFSVPHLLSIAIIMLLYSNPCTLHIQEQA